ncbi:Transmembrane ascorbate ferrireductase 1-like protein [Drosera capensis]
MNALGSICNALSVLPCAKFTGVGDRKTMFEYYGLSAALMPSQSMYLLHLEPVPSLIEQSLDQHLLESQISLVMMVSEISSSPCSGSLRICEEGLRKRPSSWASRLRMERLLNLGDRDGLWLALVTHFMALASAVMLLVWCFCFRGGFAFSSSNKELIFNLHPLLMLLGFIISEGQSLVMCRALSSTHKSPKRKLLIKVVHMAVHAVALALGIAGICFALAYHIETGTMNMYSLHSWLGITVILLFTFQWMHGVLALLYPSALSRLRSGSSHGRQVKFHLSIFILAIGTAVLGFVQKLTSLESSGLAKSSSEALLVNFTAVATMLYGIFVVIVTIRPLPQTEEYCCGYAPLISQC